MFDRNGSSDVSIQYSPRSLTRYLIYQFNLGKLEDTLSKVCLCSPVGKVIPGSSDLIPDCLSEENAERFGACFLLFRRVLYADSPSAQVFYTRDQKINSPLAFSASLLDHIAVTLHYCVDLIVMVKKTSNPRQMSCTRGTSIEPLTAVQLQLDRHDLEMQACITAQRKLRFTAPHLGLTFKMRRGGWVCRQSCRRPRVFQRGLNVWWTPETLHSMHRCIIRPVSGLQSHYKRERWNILQN